MVQKRKAPLILVLVPFVILFQLFYLYNKVYPDVLEQIDTQKRTIYPTIEGEHGNGTDCEYLWTGASPYPLSWLSKWYYQQPNETYTFCTNVTGFTIFLDGCRPHKGFDGNYTGPDWQHSGGLALWLFVIFELLVGIIAIMPHWEEILQIIADRLHMSDDVAGATLMAAGTSSTQFYIVMMQIGNSLGSLGGGAIVGSTLWNTLVICGVTLIFSPGGWNAEMLIDYRAVWRDSFFNILCFIWITVIFIDGEIWWWESLIGVLAYIGFCIFLKFQWRIYRIFKPFAKDPRVQKYLCCCLPKDKIIKRSAHETEAEKIAAKEVEEAQEVNPEGSTQPKIKRHWLYKAFACRSMTLHDGTKRSWYHGIWFFFEWPWRFLYHYTIPEPTLLHKHCSFAAHFTFWICIAYFIANTYTLTLAMIQVGCIWNMTDDLIGVTFLAMGASFPDCMSSFTVARKGMGSFAIANGLGSTTFNNFFALGFPWLLSFIIFRVPVTVSNVSLNTYMIWAWIMLAFINVAFAIQTYKVRKVWGWVFLVMYCLFIAFCVLYNKLAFPWQNPHP